MRKNACILFLLIPVVSIVWSCKDSMGTAGPKEVLSAFFERLSKKDVDGAAKLATKDSKPILDLMKTALAQAEKMEELKDRQKDFEEEYKNVEIGDAKINGDAATVTIRNKKKDQEVEFPLKKEGGEWKVDFSMTAMMQMRSKDGSGHRMDSDSVDMDNIDTAAMRRGLQMADSVMKNMDPEKLKQMQKTLEKLKEQQ